MATRSALSVKTWNNWLVDAALFMGALVSSISGIYFLFFPVGGYQGGRNPMYGITVLFQRETWDDLHTWFGIGMILAAAIHIVIHWNWIVNMTKRLVHELIKSERRLNKRSRFNLGINMLVGLGFLVTAVSGVYLLFFPGGAHGVTDPEFLFNRTTWDLVHTWAGIVMIVAAIVHFAIHWGWVQKVTSKMLRMLKSESIKPLAMRSGTGISS